MVLNDRKEKYKRLIELLSKGENYTSAGKTVGYSFKHVSRLAKKPYFAKRIAAAQEELKGKIQGALVTRALGTKIKKFYQQVDKFGDVHDLEEEIEVLPDVKAQEIWLKAKDKEGGWVNDTQGNSYINQTLINVSTDDLLLTLKTGGGGSPALANGVAREQKEPSKLPIINSNASNTDLRGYDPNYDVYHEAKGKKMNVVDNFHDPAGEGTPTEGMLENVGEDYPDGGE